MSSSNSNDPNDQSIVKDRQIPEIGTAEKSNNIVIYIGVAAMLGLILYINVAGEDEKEVPMTKKKAEEFRPSNIVQKPIIVTRKPSVAPAPALGANPNPQKAQVARNPLEQKRYFMMQDAALRMAQNNRKKAEQRKRSPIMLFDNSGKEKQNKTTDNSAQMSVQESVANQLKSFNFGSNQKSDAPKLSRENQFLNNKENNSVSMVSASTLQNQDSLIAQGSLINGILETAIQSNLPGFIRAVVSHPVYSFDGTTLLIPEGSRLIGKYQAGIKNGQTRVFIIWSRVLRPDGVSILIGSPGTDRLGRAGLGGDVDTHFWERFGTSILMSFIDGGIQAGVNSVDNRSASTIAVNTGSGFSKATETILEYSINIEPTLHVDQGTRINVFVAKDLDFSNVQNKRVR